MASERIGKSALEALSSEQLYALAQQKEREEEAESRDEQRARVDALRAERRKMVKEHKRELAVVDADIRRLTGETPRARGAASKVLQIVLLEGGEIQIDAIRTALHEAGQSPGNLNQTLAYLKRTGRIASGATRGSYKAP